jgi:hypothetical protein
MHISIRSFVAASVLLGAFIPGCIESPTEGDEALDPALEAFDDGKYDGPIVAVAAAQDYKIEVRSVSTTDDYGEWTVQPDLYLTVADAQSPVCPSADNCNFDLANVPGRLNLGSSERMWSGAELRDGVEFAVHERRPASGGGFIDEIKGLTTIRIGQTGSLRIRPFGRVKSIEFRVRF